MLLKFLLTLKQGELSMDKLQERVRQMLLKYPDTRKSDTKLMTMLWMDDLDRLMPYHNHLWQNTLSLYYSGLTSI